MVNAIPKKYTAPTATTKKNVMVQCLRTRSIFIQLLVTSFNELQLTSDWDTSLILGNKLVRISEDCYNTGFFSAVPAHHALDVKNSSKFFIFQHPVHLRQSTFLPIILLDYIHVPYRDYWSWKSFDCIMYMDYSKNNRGRFLTMV